jgi:hypothetical protein
LKTPVWLLETSTVRPSDDNEEPLNLLVAIPKLAGVDRAGRLFCM